MRNRWNLSLLTEKRAVLNRSIFWSIYLGACDSWLPNRIIRFDVIYWSGNGTRSVVVTVACAIIAFFIARDEGTSRCLHYFKLYSIGDVKHRFQSKEKEKKSRIIIQTHSRHSPCTISFVLWKIEFIFLFHLQQTNHNLSVCLLDLYNFSFFYLFFFFHYRVNTPTSAPATVKRYFFHHT